MEQKFYDNRQWLKSGRPPLQPRVDPLNCPRILCPQKWSKDFGLQLIFEFGLSNDLHPMVRRTYMNEGRVGGFLKLATN